MLTKTVHTWTTAERKVTETKIYWWNIQFNNFSSLWIHFSEACTNPVWYLSLFKMHPQQFSNVCYNPISIISFQMIQKLFTVIISQDNSIKKCDICFQYSNIPRTFHSTCSIFFFLIWGTNKSSISWKMFWRLKLFSGTFLYLAKAVFAIFVQCLRYAMCFTKIWK